jgi:hypothetical protein
MGIQTPYSIKVQVIKDWIEGISRDKIALNNNIGAGTVTSIIQQSKLSVPDMDLMRLLALKIKKENLDLNYFASSVRLKKLLDGFGLNEEKVELFIEEMNVHCFKQDMDEKEFIIKVDEVSKIVNNLEVSLYNIPKHIDKLTKYLARLENDVRLKERQIKQKIDEYNLTVSDLDEYRSNKPLVDKIRILKSRLLEKEMEFDSVDDALLKCKVEMEALTELKSARK